MHIKYNKNAYFRFFLKNIKGQYFQGKSKQIMLLIGFYDIFIYNFFRERISCNEFFDSETIYAVIFFKLCDLTMILI